MHSGLKKLKLSPRCSAEEAKRAYFEQALQSHPLIASDDKAAERFWQLSEEYWHAATGTDGLEGYSKEAILAMWIRDFAFQGVELSTFVAEQLQMSDYAEGQQRHMEASIAAKGPIKGERLQCRLCGFQVRSHSEMRLHFLTKHEEDARAWSRTAVNRAASSMVEAMTGLAREVPGPGAKRLQSHQPKDNRDSRSFHLADGSLAWPQELPPPLQMPFRLHPPSKSPQEMEVLARLQAADPGLSAFLAPWEGAELDVLAPLRYALNARGSDSPLPA
mmetsp:Transcript_60575/g.141664  ORF Transcript_60575/g.141664 Transcript_60575/m.141664 type:complete len:275 (+) Transcript_60575:78-902(+)